MKSQNKISIHYARKEVARQKLQEPGRRPSQSQPGRRPSQSHPTPHREDNATYANMAKQQRQRQEAATPKQQRQRTSGTIPRRQALPPVEGTRWDPEQRRNSERELSNYMQAQEQAQEQAQPREARKQYEEQNPTTKEEIRYIVQKTMEETLVDLLGSVLMGFTKILFKTMSHKETNKEKKTRESDGQKKKQIDKCSNKTN